MASTYSTNLKIELQATGENSGTWGTITNTNLGTALEQAIVGYGNPSYASDANLTLTYTDTNAAQAARALVLNVTSAVSLTATRELVVPTIQKQYIVQNNTTGSQSITVKTSAGTGITVPNGRKAHLYVDGTNVIYMDDYVDINGGAIDGTPIGANSASTGAFTTLSASSTVSGTGFSTYLASPPAIGSTAANTGAFTTLTTSSTVTLNGGTADGVLYLNGSKVATSGSALRFDGTNLGIGTVAALPVAPLSIGDGSVLQFYGVLDAFPSATSDTAAVIGRTGGGGVAPFNNAGSLIYRPRVTTTAGRGSHIFYTGSPSAERLRIDESGNVGIGTTSPIYKLHVENNAASTTNIAVLNTSASSGAYAQVRVQGDSGIGYFGYAGSGNAAGGLYDADCVYLASESTAAALCIGTSGGSAPIRFFTNGSAAASERMRIDSTGLVGIGTTSPGSLYSGANNLVVGGGSGSTGMTVYSGTTGVGRLFFADGTVGADAYRGWVEYGHTANNLTFGTDGATRVTIDSSGNLGLGVTPSAWGSNFLPVLQIKTGTAGVGTLCGTANDNFRMFCNAYYDGAAYKRIGAGYATVYQQDTGGHYWFTAGTSTAGSTISFTQAMTLDASGNLSVNTTSAIASAANRGNITIGGSAGSVLSLGTSASAYGYLFYDTSNSSMELWNYSNSFMRFGTNNAERARITAGGNLLVGGTAARATTDGAAQLVLFNGTAPAGTLTNGVSLYSSSGDLNFMDSGGTGYKIGYRNVPQSGSDKTTSYSLATTDVGKFVGVGTSGSITVPNSTFAAGDIITIFNNTSGNVTLTMSITTAYIAGTNTDKDTLTLATRGVATILFISGTVCVVTGNVS